MEENSKKRSTFKIKSRDNFIQLLKNKKMPENEAVDLVDSIYNQISDTYKIKTEEGNTPKLDEASNKQRNIVFTQFYSLVADIYQIKQVAELHPKVQNDIVRKILEHCKTSITKDFNSWDSEASIEFIKLLFDKYKDTNSDEIITCVEHYIKCGKKDLIDKIINKIVKEVEKPCDIAKLTQLLQIYNVMIDKLIKYELEDKGNNKKIKIDILIEFAEFCIENKLSSEEIVELFRNATIIIKNNPGTYYDVIENNYEQVKKGKLDARKVIDIIKENAKNASNTKKQKEQTKAQKSEQTKKSPKSLRSLINRLRGATKRKDSSHIKTNEAKIIKIKKSRVYILIALVVGFALGKMRGSQPQTVPIEEGIEYADLMDALSEDFKSTDFIENLPISIQCTVKEKLGPYGPNEGSLVIARVSVNGDMHSIIWQDDSGKYHEITNNLDVYMNNLYVVDGIRETKIIVNYKGDEKDSTEFNKDDTVEIIDGPYYDADGNELVTVRVLGGYTENIPYSSVLESMLGINQVQAYARGLVNMENTNLEARVTPQPFTLNRDFEDLYSAGDTILGYITVEQGELFVKGTKTVNGEEEDISIPLYGYFDTSNLDVKTTNGLISKMIGENATLTTKDNVCLWRNNYDELISVIPEGEQIQVMIYEKDEENHLIGTVNNIDLGDIEGYVAYDALEYYMESMQPETMKSWINENYADEENAYYNGIFVPTSIKNDNLEEFLNIQLSNTTKMPNTKNDDNEMVYIEISGNSSGVIKRIKTITDKTGMPYGLIVKFDSKKTTIEEIKDIIVKIQSSEYGNNLQGGIIVDPRGLPEDKYEYVKNELGIMKDYNGNPVTETQKEYTDEISKINSLIQTLKNLRIRVTILDDVDSSLEINDIKSADGYGLKVSRNKDNKIEGAVQKYIDSNYTNQGIDIFVDMNQGQLAISDDIVREALLQIANQSANDYTIDASKMYSGYGYGYGE